MTVQLGAGVGLENIPISKELSAFAVDDPGDEPGAGSADFITLRHHFDGLPPETWDWGREAGRNGPLILSRRDSGEWVYRVCSSDGNGDLLRAAVFSNDHRRAEIYSAPDVLDRIRAAGLRTLSLLPSDQVWLREPLAARSAIMIHSAAAALNGQGLVFVAPSTAGKSSAMEHLKAARGRIFENKALEVEILCDDRNILWRKIKADGTTGWSVTGTWFPSSMTDVSPGPAPLRAILFLEASPDNEIVPFNDRKIIWKKLLRTLPYGVMTAELWQKQADIVQQLIANVPFFLIRFDKTEAIVSKLSQLADRMGR